ncbi:MAG: hypothetical protein ABIT37_20835, partial [Luteolibacter sp.]
LGISTTGTMAMWVQPFSEDYNAPKRIDLFDSTGALTGSIDGTDGYHPMPGDDYGNMTPSGWIVSNLAREATGPQSAGHKLGLWNAAGTPVPLPSEAAGIGSPVIATDMPTGKAALVAGTIIGDHVISRIFLPDSAGNYQYDSTLSALGIHLFAGDGTAMTDDGKLWRNGKLIPLRELCAKYKELEDEGYSLFPLKANKDGIYLIQAQDPQGGVKTFVTGSLKIVPDENMAGVIGDEIVSLIPNSKIKHFVTPKQTAEINQDYVILKAAGITAEQITDGNANQLYEWDTAAGEAVPNEPLKWRVKRDATAKSEVKIKVKQDGAVAAQMDVWVVWATCTPTNGVANFNRYTGYGRYEVLPNDQSWWRFKFKIEPTSICNPATPDRPDLTGANKKQPPGFGNTYTVDPTVGPSDTATAKWDVSRQYKTTIHNPNSIPQNDLLVGGLVQAWVVNQPKSDDTPVSFPVSDVEGNDDPLKPPGIDEDTNPYKVLGGGSVLNHNVGELSSIDAPGIPAVDWWGTANMTIAVEHNFREFARLELWDGAELAGNFGLEYRTTCFGIIT